MFKAFMASIFAALLGVEAFAQDMRTEPVQFAAGQRGTTITDSITGYESVLYKVSVEAGQRLKLRLEPSNLATYFNLYAPGSGPGDTALASGQFLGDMTPDLNIFDGVLEISGEYTVSVFMMRAAARRDEVSNYALFVSIEGEIPGSVSGDYADGLQGGPDFYEVSTTSGGPLNLRSSPSIGASVVTQLSDGQSIRNLGCRLAEGRRWCRVATLADPGFEGWAAGDYLIEGANGTTQGSGG